MWSCKYCKNEFDFKTTSEKANHTRWCNKNPKRNQTKSLQKAQQKILNIKFGELKDFGVICEVCKKPFLVTERRNQFPKKEKYFCSRKCACSIGGKKKAEKYGLSKYRTICFKFHKKECIICGEDKIVSVHHYDGNHKNNSPENLIPMCPTHHQYMHSNFKHLIEKEVNKYFGDRRAVSATLACNQSD